MPARRLIVRTLAGAALAATPAALAAQQPGDAWAAPSAPAAAAFAPAPTAPAAVAPAPRPEAPASDGALAAGPALRLAPAALTARGTRAATVEQEQEALRRRARNGLEQSQVLMIVGGSAVVLGLVAGGDAESLLVIGGAVVGLYGLYKYLQ